MLVCESVWGEVTLLNQQGTSFLEQSISSKPAAQLYFNLFVPCILIHNNPPSCHISPFHPPRCSFAASDDASGMHHLSHIQVNREHLVRSGILSPSSNSLAGDDLKNTKSHDT